MDGPLLGRVVAGLLVCATTSACSTQSCEGVAVGAAAGGLEIKVGDGELKRIGGEYFGFNLESTEFQLSLWDKATRTVAPEVVSTLRAFEGAVYRFPGGTTANYYRWKAGAGPAADRPAARITDWIELPRIDFGIDEYFDFVKKVNGLAWYVLNLQGSIGRPAEIGALADEAEALSRHTADKSEKMLRWELGNELDRAHDMWPSAQYVERARIVLAAVRAVLPEAKFVGMMADYDAQKDRRNVTSSQYNRAVAAGLGELGVHEYEQHIYYDGPPEGPDMPNRLRQLCRSIEDARKAGVPGDKLAFWITEHARWPQAEKGAQWNSSWRKTADLGAAIGVADMLIALTQIPEVRGSAIHALHATNGPWPLFHRKPGDASRHLHPSVTLHAYRVLNQALLPVVLPSRSSSSSRSGYSGGYDARGAVLASPDRKRFSVWTVNRQDLELPVTLQIPKLAGKDVTATLRHLGGTEQSAHNYEKPATVLPADRSVRLSFDENGRGRYSVPRSSVATLTMEFID